MSNRRASERRVQREAVRIRPLSDGASVPGFAVNLSEGGALVELARPLAADPTLVILELELDGVPTRLQAIVQRTELYRGRSRVGLCFVYLGEQGRYALRLQLRHRTTRAERAPRQPTKGKLSNRAARPGRSRR